MPSVPDFIPAISNHESSWRFLPASSSLISRFLNITSRSAMIGIFFYVIKVIAKLTGMRLNTWFIHSNLSIDPKK
tara:strand:+ start:98 stop:322 length:225 start_codon:yes stop_codon:yes gene_type:complete